MEFTRDRHARRHVSGVAFLAALTMGTSAVAGVTEVGAGYFGASATVITFSELAEGTLIPFSIGLADFSGSGGIIYSFAPGDPFAPPSPSDSPFLYSGSDGVEDWIEVLLGAPQEAVGAYFNSAGSSSGDGVLQLELYSGETLLGMLATTPNATQGGFVGASAGEAVIDRVIFRDIDDTLPVSFRIDDFQFVPTPGAAPLMLLAALGRRRRR